MSACPDRYENILLDIYGELDPAQRSSLGEHLADCANCREEHLKVLRLVEQIKTGFPAPVLSEDKAKALFSSVTYGLLREKAPWTFWKGFLSPSRLVPSLAAACLVVVFVGWFSLKMGLYSPSQEKYARNGMQEQPVNPNDIEVISNLDLLEELDVLRTLVNVVDGKETL